MAQEQKEIIPLPEGITAKAEDLVLTITGPKGDVTRAFRHPRVVVSVSSQGVEFYTKIFTRAEKKIMNTYVAHVKNMIIGATQGHEYKLKICSGHFPMNVSLKGQKLEVKNFIGEVVPRTLEFKEGVQVKINGDVIVVTGIDKELVSQSAASIEKLTRRNGFDHRIFQDGIYIIEKDGKKV